MGECERTSILYSLYVYDDVTEEEKNIVEGHISRCEICASEVNSLRETLQLLSLEIEPSIPEHIVDNFETNVYKRIAAEVIWNPDKEKIKPPRRDIFTDFWERLWARPSLFLKMASVAIVLGAGIIIGVLQFSQGPEIVEKEFAITPSTSLVISVSPSERLKKHFQTERYRQLENALLSRYVAGDELRAMEILNRLSDENPGPQMISVVDKERRKFEQFKNGI